MAVSDQLTKLASRAKVAEDHAAAAEAKAKSQVQADVEKALASAEANAEQLKKSRDATQAKAAGWRRDLQSHWDGHVSDIRKDFDSKRKKLDASSAAKDAEVAEGNAMFLIDYAYSAIETAEYAVLDAVLARMEADELTGAGKAR